MPGTEQGAEGRQSRKGL